MTFTEIQTQILSRLGLTSTDASTRIGIGINRHYKRTTAALGIAGVSRRVTVTGNTAIGSVNVTFSTIEKIERVMDLTDADNPLILQEKTFDVIRQKTPFDSDDATEWAVERMGSTTILVRMNVTFESVKTYTADGYTTQSTLSGAQVPAFPETFHDILVERVMADELRKQEKPGLAKEAKGAAEQMLSDLKMWIATSAYRTMQQGGAARSGTTP